MSAKKNTLFVIIAMLAVLLMGFLQPANVLANEQKGSITVEYPVDNVSFRMYYVGTKDDKVGYSLIEPFASYQVNLEESGVAAALAGYVNRDQESISALDTRNTENGQVVFADLENGVYLILGEVKTVDDVTYTPSPILVEIPGWSEDELEYDVTVKDKWSETALTELKVCKVWQDDNSADRPERIVVQLTGNGEVVDEKTLDADNEWAAKWSELDSSCSWDVIEKEVPKGYVVSYEKKHAGDVVITNALPDTPPSTPEEPQKDNPSKLPQTGQLWWPVSVLLIAGLVCILAGLLIRKRQMNIEE